jgi:hypothetical protein
MANERNFAIQLLLLKMVLFVLRFISLYLIVLLLTIFGFLNQNFN